MSGYTPGPWEANGDRVYFGRDGGISLHMCPSPEANARLIAAAPELLEALMWYVENDDVNEGDPENGFWVDGLIRAQSAIAKATGADQ